MITEAEVKYRIVHCSNLYLHVAMDTPATGIYVINYYITVVIY